MTDLRECRTCAYVVYGLRSKAWCHRNGSSNGPDVAPDDVCDRWSERPDPFEPREEDEE